MATKAHIEGNRRYLEKLDEIKIRVPKGHKAEIQAHAEQQRESVNAFIKRAVDNQMKRDNGNPEGAE